MDIKNVSIVGAGMMGKMIAWLFSGSFNVVVYDALPIDVAGGIRDAVKTLVEKGKLSGEDLSGRLARIRFTQDMDDAVKDADMVVEAVYEDMELKREVFARIEKFCRSDCILCTNTSVMSPSEISRDLTRRERFAGTHFWNPAHLIPLVEVVMSDATSPQTAETVIKVLESVGKKPVLCKRDVPGFIANRLQHALWREAFFMVENGIADAKTVDDACKFGPGLRWPVLGPMENSDLVGIDLTYNIHDYILESLADNHRPSRRLTEMLGEGKLGMKSGEGWQKWTPQEAELLSSALRDYLIDKNM